MTLISIFLSVLILLSRAFLCFIALSSADTLEEYLTLNIVGVFLYSIVNFRRLSFSTNSMYCTVFFFCKSLEAVTAVADERQEIKRLIAGGRQ